LGSRRPVRRSAWGLCPRNRISRRRICRCLYVRYRVCSMLHMGELSKLSSMDIDCFLGRWAFRF
jgi:hypothetical protein